MKKKVLLGIERFTKNPHDKILRNHPLKGRLIGKRAFSVTSDMRIVFEEYNSYTLVIMFHVGTHNQVY
ncbi:type II toxin-antitoxin system mRNA interferase toxin, RelE/StbE family [Candidatus Peregrinibacteria bacterium]|nr:type II toxin-antitoxin system mRNA interferase toxin, RelE/StbE family [Candidatus Peregrinibacteria bacterium]